MQEIPWFTPELAGTELTRIKEAIDANFLNDGCLTTEFEQRCGELCDAKYAVAVTSGTAAITLALLAAGADRGHPVAVPDLTFIATVNAARLAGCRVRLIDIKQPSLTMKEDYRRFAIPVDVNGYHAKYKSLSADGINIRDACESFPRLLESDDTAMCVSFSPNKIISTGQGGMVLTNDSKLHDRLRELKDQGRRMRGTGGDDLHDRYGFNFKFTDLQAAVGLAQLDRLKQRQDSQCERHYQYFEAGIAAIEGIYPRVEALGTASLWQQVMCDDRTKVCAALDAADIGYRRFWLPIHRQKPYKMDDDLFPNAISASERGLWLPSSFSITAEQIKRVCEVIKEAAA